jgi:hypothetical protein
MGLIEIFSAILAENGLNWLMKPAQIERNSIAEAHDQRRKMLIEAKTQNDIEKFKQGLVGIDNNGDIMPAINLEKIMLDDEKNRIFRKKINLLNTTEKPFFYLIKIINPKKGKQKK